MVKSCITFQRVEQAELSLLFNKYDIDRDGTLSQVELLPFYSDLCERRRDVYLKHNTFEAWLKSECPKSELTIEDLKAYLDRISYILGCNLYCDDCLDETVHGHAATNYIRLC